MKYIALLIGIALILSYASLHKEPEATGGPVQELGNSITITEEQLTPLIQAEQANYFTQFGYYFQVPPTHNTIPTEGTPLVADLLKIPGGRAEVQTLDALAALKLQSNKEYLADFRLTINTCERGSDRGYTVIYERRNVLNERQVKRVGHGVCGESNDWRTEQRISDL